MTRAEEMRFRLTSAHARLLRGPRPEQIEARIEDLPRDGYLVLEHLDRDQEYVQVRLRPDGVFQLEVRDGSADRHLGTRTVSREKVAAAFAGWQAELLGGGRDWRAEHQWEPVVLADGTPDGTPDGPGRSG